MTRADLEEMAEVEGSQPQTVPLQYTKGQEQGLDFAYDRPNALVIARVYYLHTKEKRLLTMLQFFQLLLRRGS